MKSYRAVTSKASGLYETCARHTARSTARTLQTIYLCDPCARRLVSEAFNRRPPVYHGQTIEGYCGLCSRKRDVTCRQWFVCGPCWNVVLAYQKSVAASRAVHEWWAKTMKPRFPKLNLEETEPVYLSPYVRGGMTKLQAAVGLSVLDFLVSDNSTNPPTPLFHIEQKTGPGSIDNMSVFQLDVNDFNDIAGAVNKTELPSYIVHVQAGREFDFPTSKTVVQGMWWTDVFLLQENQKHVGARRNGDKDAISYKPEAFKSIDSFPGEIANRGFEKLTAKLRRKKLRLVS